MKKRSIFSIALIVVLCLTVMLSLVACNKDKNKTEEKNDTLVVGYSRFSNKFSPFFAKTSYDQDVANMTQVGLLASDRGGAIIYKGIEGETHAYNGTDYTYKGLADLTVTMPTASDTNVYYDIKIRDDVKFSDGTALTIDDVIFTMYALSDPTYDGSSSFYTLPIEGMIHYRTGVADEAYEKYQKTVNAIIADQRKNESTADYTKAEFDMFWGYIDDFGDDFAQEIIDYVTANYLTAEYAAYLGKYTLAEAQASTAIKNAYGMAMWGFGDWNIAYTADTAGAYGKVGEEYKKLYVVNNDAAAADVVFELAENKYVAAGAATTGWFYVSAADDNGVTAVTAYSGERYKAGYDGQFVDANDKLYTMVGEDYPTATDYWNNIVAKYGWNLSDKGIGKETAGTDLIAKFSDKFIIDKAEADGKTSEVNNITGIDKISATELRITMTKFDAVSIYQLGISVAPLHYYGDTAKYDYANNKFGFTKGDLTSVRSKTTSPLGAGAYVFQSYQNGVVTFKANPNYYLGGPKITNVLFKETDDADKISGIQAGTFDISDPSISNTAIAAIKKANGSDSLTGSALTTNLVDFLGYGYIGINADKVKVGDDASSDASKNLRKAFATVMASQREVAINSYYGDRATVINYPISNTSWAAPQSTDTGYNLAYNKDVNGDAIYAADDAQSVIDTKVKAAALGFFNAAGYTVVNGKVTAAPAGAKMNYEVLIPGDGTGDHPSFAIVSNAAALLKDIGITLTVNDLSNSQVLWDRIEGATQEMWCAAWGATVDPDMYQVYFSTNVVGGGGTDSNHYHIQDTDLDKWIMDARKTDDQTTRKAYYKQCLDRIMDWGVEIPVYQRKDCIVISTQRVDVNTVTKDITPFYGWMSEIEKLELK